MSPSALHFFLFYCYGAHRDLHSFPTRRSSDLFLVLRNSEYAILKWFGSIEQVEGAPGLDLPDLDCAAVEVGEVRSEEHTSELQSHSDLVCRLLLEKKKTQTADTTDVLRISPRR